jgi:hypothetical protein
MSSQNTSSKKIPNTLIIYIKTRVPNYYKITYEPNMSIPKIKSGSVYFNPLVKYYASVVNNPPSGSPPDTKLAQFFDINKFESMINRILSDFRYMQPTRTLNQATNEKIIDNNIKITLNTLFAPNNILYLKDVPYTIIGYKWKIGEWKLDIKPIDKLINPFVPISGKELENAQKELDEIPEEIREGAISSSNENMDFSTLQNVLGKGLDKKESQIKILKPVIESQPIIKDKNVLQNMFTGFKNLYGKYLQKNNAINFGDEKDLMRDPITFSLLLDNQQLLNYFSTKTEESNKLSQLYTNYIHNKKRLKELETTFFDFNTKIGIFKEEFNIFLRNIDKNFTEENIQKLKDYKNNYMIKLNDVYQSLIDIFDAQNIYFFSLDLLLKNIKDNYEKIFVYYKEPEIALKCIDLDINTYNLFVTLDSTNNDSVSYFNNIKRAKDVANLIKNSKNQNSTEIINNNILIIIKNQYELYLLRSLQLYHYNQLDIWKNYYDSLTTFISEIGTYTNSVLKDTDEKLVRYNNKYDNKKQSDFLNFYKVDGMRFFIDKNGKKQWNLVNSKGEKVIRKNKNVIKLTNKDYIMEKDYIDVVKSEINCYDMIILYTYLLEIQCLRQSNVYTAEENVYQIEYENCILLKNYFIAIKNYIESNVQNISIPSSLMWNVSEFDDINFINTKIEKNYMIMSLYTNKISEVHKSFDDINKYCDDLYQSLYPAISETFLNDQCNKLISENISKVPEYKTRSNYWLKKEIKNYDIRNSNDLNYYINEIIGDAYAEYFINELQPQYYQDWAIYDNEGGGDCFFAAIRDALNGQLDILNAKTNNIYTEKINGEKKFTIRSLRKIVSDNFTQNDYNFYTIMLGSPDKNGLYQLDPSDELNIMAYKLLINNNQQLRSYNDAKEIITQPCTYWADELAIKYIQNVLKIGIIIFNMVERPVDKFLIGDTILLLEDGKQYKIIDITGGNDKEYILQGKDKNIISNITPDKITTYSDNIFSKFRIECPIEDFQFEIKDYIFIAKTSLQDEAGNSVIHYELVRNTGIGMYVYNFSQIPEYIKYLVYENCYRYFKPDIRENIGFSKIKEFTDLFKEYENKVGQEKRKEGLDVEDILIDIEDPLIALYDDTNEKILENSAALESLKTIENPDNTIIEDIERTTNIINDLKEKLAQINVSLEKKFAQKGGQELKPNQEYYQYMVPNPYFNQNYYSIPRPAYPYNPSYLSSSNYANKIKETSSKTAYYVNIDLELFPGKNITMAQKLQSKCDSNFENIREAYANLFGYEYRPSEMKGVYSYQAKLAEEKQRKKVKETDEQTRKNRNILEKYNPRTITQKLR